MYWYFHAQPFLGFTENGQKEKISSEQQLCGRKCLVDVRGEWADCYIYDRKATVTQIPTCYNQGMLNTISECTTRRTLKQMGYSSRRPHWVPLLSDKNRKRRLQFAQAHQNWTREDWKNVAWSDKSDFCCDIQMVGSEFGVKNVKVWIKPALSQQFRLMVVV